MIDRLPELPVAAVLPELQSALSGQTAAVLVAPPGAGKTTLVPLALLQAGWRGDGMVLLLEPRRLAARAAARRMAALLGEEVGETVGYAMRMERLSGSLTRILVVTEGLLSRMILDDPELRNVACIIFDEFHERSLDGDFGLALALDVKNALRPDLRTLVMSATIDAARVAALLGGAPVIESAGRSHPVAIRHRPRAAGEAVELAVAAAVRDALSREEGSILAFLPGQKEIERAAGFLSEILPADVILAPLHGQMDAVAQDAAIRPAPPGQRKVVLATSVAETSITIEDVRVVIDSGLARLPRYEPHTGLTRLETVRASQAAVAQRAGRAGRIAPGIAIRLWRAEQTTALPPHTPPEILSADLAGLVLDCAAFGVTDPSRLAFLDPPPQAALKEARSLLETLGALDTDGRLTKRGQAMRKLALPARLAHMVTEAARFDDAETAAMLAVLITERGLGSGEIDMEHRLQRLRSERGRRAEQARALAARIARQAGGGRSAEPTAAGRLLLHAYPDRIAKARGQLGHFVLANGRGAVLDPAEPLARSTFLVVAELQGKAQNARILAAATISEADIRTVLADRISTEVETGFDLHRGAVRAREITRLGAIHLSRKPLPSPRGTAADRAILAALRTHGLHLLPWQGRATALRQRLAWLHRVFGNPWPAVDDDTLMARLEEWLLPFLTGEAELAALGCEQLAEALLVRLPPTLRRNLDRLAPSHFLTPTGGRFAIDYGRDEPTLSVRVQELFGLDYHPTIGDGIVPLTLELLSPARRPIQTTRDLPAFWRGSWSEVRAAMRGRYPKHPWPEDPLSAQVTTRDKPRGERVQ